MDWGGSIFDSLTKAPHLCIAITGLFNIVHFVLLCFSCLVMFHFKFKHELTFVILNLA